MAAKTDMTDFPLLLKLWAAESYEKPLFNLDPKREELYETCQRMGVGITVMKAFGGGDLLSDKYSPAGKAMTALQTPHSMQSSACAESAA